MSPISNREMFRKLPSVDELLKSPALEVLAGEHGRATVLEAVRAELERLRTRIAEGRMDEPELEGAVSILPEAVGRRLTTATAPSLRKVINASGVLIHTNLGRAPLSKEAVRRVAEIAGGYSNLEFDLEKGERGRRDEHAQHLFAQLFAREGVGGSSAIVVNNNAAAVVLALSALAAGGEVVISRGELVEIGGSFRVPEIMVQSGAVLREVGTTNRTRIEDYKNAITENTRLLLRVHRSNFEIVGFTEQPELRELAELARQSGVPLMEDLGSGALVRLEEYGIAGEPNVYESLRAGVNVVTFSGDKLLGGPQAGVAAGDPELIGRMRRHPLFRALRVDKMCYAALEATLAAYLRERYEDVPVLGRLKATPEEIRQRCERLANAARGLEAEVHETRCVIGGGAAPGKAVASFAVSLRADGMNATELARKLREQATPVVARVDEDRVLLDLRTVDAKDDSYLMELLARWTQES